MPRKPAGEPDGSAGESAESETAPATDRDGDLVPVLGDDGVTPLPDQTDRVFAPGGGD